MDESEIKRKFSVDYPTNCSLLLLIYYFNVIQMSIFHETYTTPKISLHG